LSEPDESFEPKSTLAEMIGILFVAAVVIAIQLVTGIPGLFAAAFIAVAAALGLLLLLRRC